MTGTDWPERRLGDLASMASGGTPTRSVSRYFGGGIPWVSISDMTSSGKYVSATSTTLTDEGLKSSSAKLYEADVVLYAMYASLGEVGLAVGRVASSQAILGIQPTKELDREFLYYYLEALKPLVKKMGQQGTQSNLNAGMVRDFRLGLPSLSEQRSIAMALADVDDLIEALHRRIAKGMAIKRGMMQQLLTGRTRLPGFEKSWTEHLLGELAQFSKGIGLPKSSVIDGGRFPCIHYGELFTRYGAEIRVVQGRTNDTRPRVRSSKGDVLMPTSDVTPRGLAKASSVLVDGVILGGDILIARPDASRLFGPFLAYSIRHDADQVLQLVRGSTVFHIYAADMKNFNILVPEVAEQQAICDALRDVESEIDLLRVRLIKARQIKQGMMQELLTGRTRLPVQEAAA